MTALSNDENKHKVKPWLKVDSFDELMKHEKEIVKHISEVRNGGHLFLIHPFMLLADIGVELSERATKELKQHEPQLGGLSPIPYQALKRSDAKQTVRFHLKGLFERRGKS